MGLGKIRGYPPALFAAGSQNARDRDDPAFGFKIPIGGCCIDPKLGPLYYFTDAGLAWVQQHALLDEQADDAA